MRLGAGFLLDVFLHSSERQAVKPWLGVLQLAFARSRAACEWFLEALVDADCRWLAGYLLQCPDAAARAAFVHLVARVVALLAPAEAAQLRAGADARTAAALAAAAHGAAAAAGLAAPAAAARERERRLRRARRRRRRARAAAARRPRA